MGPAAQALAVRRGVMHLLADPGTAGEAWGAAARCSLEAWRLFLRVEDCALPLRARLGAAEPLAAGVRREVERTAGEEVGRVLAARAELAALGRTARALGVQAVLLKGGVAAAQGELLDLLDVDLLLSPGDARAFAAALDRAGYAAAGADAAGPEFGVHHLAERRAPNSLPIEIHFDLKGVDGVDAFRARAVPLDAAPGLARPAADDQLWHLLVHATHHHPARRARIRDLLLIGRAAAECAPEERARVDARVRAHPAARDLAAVLAAAQALRGSGPPLDPHRRMAAAIYLFLPLSERLRLPPLVQKEMFESLAALSGGPEDRRLYRRAVTRRTATPSELPGLAGLERRLPALLSPLRVAIRAGRHAVWLAAAAPLALRARALAARADGP
ncbi:MAG TPA: nucleotidyltransferase family protein [Longimicrobiaceae bacterium]|nr:nucleotidyltransferase family protein [Longimicrobiaceae bacterium]